MRIFVTGATGFIGRALVARLLEASYEVVAWVRDVDRAADILLPQDGILTPLAALKIAFTAPRTAFHRRRTLKGLMDAYTSDPKLKALWSAQYGDYALPPYKASAVYHGTVLTHFLKGADRPVKGLLFCHGFMDTQGLDHLGGYP